jgi:uncharacterized protein (DUF1697 family)
MALVVFLRGVNVGGRKAFQPSALAHEMADLDVVSIGAAGTFVVRTSLSASSARDDFGRQLPFDAEMMICQAREVLGLITKGPFGTGPSEAGTTRYVSVLEKRPRTLPPLPIVQPAGDAWQVKVFSVSGRFALSLHRRQGRTLVYPNEVVEKKLGVSATTRNWNTISAVCDVLTGRRER